MGHRAAEYTEALGSANLVRLRASTPGLCVELLLQRSKELELNQVLGPACRALHPHEVLDARNEHAETLDFELDSAVFTSSS